MIYVTHDQAEAAALGERIAVMDRGSVQQVGSPLALYDRPVNRFVAGFLGGSPMSFLTGCVHSRSDTLCFKMNCQELPLPVELASVLVNYREKEIVLGLRPEHLSILRDSREADDFLSATVIGSQYLGDRTEVALVDGSRQRLTLYVDPHQCPKMNETLRLKVDLGKAHFFEADEMGKRIG